MLVLGDVEVGLWLMVSQQLLRLQKLALQDFFILSTHTTKRSKTYLEVIIRAT